MDSPKMEQQYSLKILLILLLLLINSITATPQQIDLKFTNLFIIRNNENAPDEYLFVAPQKIFTDS